MYTESIFLFDFEFIALKALTFSSAYTQRTESESGSVELRDETLIWPYKEEFGTRFRVHFESIRFKLQAPLDSGDGPLSQVSQGQRLF